MNSAKALCVVLSFLILVPVVLAEEAAQPAATSESTKATTTETNAFQQGDWFNWPKMTGDWGGTRSQLANMGITFDVDVTQVMQGNAHGGKDTKNGFRYSGSGDLTLNLDFGKMDLWKGGSLLLHAEPKWGDGIIDKSGALVPVNLDAVLPGYNEGCMMTLSEWILQQVLLDGKLILIGGKLWGARAFDANAFANDEHSQFMNFGLRNNVMIPPFLPYTNLGAGAIVNPTDWLSILTAVADTEGKAKTTGFETTFHGPTHTSVIHEWDFKLKPFEKPGTYRVGFVWSSMEFAHLQPISPFRETGPLLMKLLGPKVMGMMKPYLPTDTSPDNVMVYVNFDQYVYTEAQDPTQGIGVFGRFGWARSDVNPADHFYSIGVGGKGVIPDRDKDTCGLGYYFMNLSDDMPDMFHSEQGIEAYYNIEIAPWLHISPDLQVIVNPGGTDDNDVAIVYGVRMQMNL